MTKFWQHGGLLIEAQYGHMIVWFNVSFKSQITMEGIWTRKKLKRNALPFLHSFRNGNHIERNWNFDINRIGIVPLKNSSESWVNLLTFHQDTANAF